MVENSASNAKVAYFVVSNKLLAIGKAHSDLKQPHVAQEGNLYWYAETPDFSLSLPNKRTLDMLQVMLSGKGDYAVFVAFDVPPEEKDNSKIPWQIVDADVFRGQQAIRIPICTKPCHSMRIRISGNGEATIYSILRSIYEIYEENEWA